MPPSVIQNNYGRLADPGASAGIGQIDLIDASGQLLQSWQIRTPKCTIGSSSECSISIADGTVAAVHATLIFGKRHTLLKANAFPTKIAGRNIREWLIDDPTEVIVGNSRLIIFPSLSVKAQVVPAQNLASEAARLSKPNAPVINTSVAISTPPIAETRDSETTFDTISPSLGTQSNTTSPISAPTAAVSNVPDSHASDSPALNPAVPNTVPPSTIHPIAVAPVAAYEQFVASTQDTLRDIQTLLGELHQTVDEVRSTVTNDQSASNAVKSVVESVTNEFGSVGQRWFADLSSQFATQQSAQSSLINELSSDINNRFSNIESQLKAITESASKESTLIAEQLEQARASQNAIEQRFEHLEAQKNELFEALSSLRSEVLNFSSQQPATRFTQETNPQPDSGLGYFAELDYQPPQSYATPYSNNRTTEQPPLPGTADTQDYYGQPVVSADEEPIAPSNESSVAENYPSEYGSAQYSPVGYTPADYDGANLPSAYAPPAYSPTEYAPPEYASQEYSSPEYSPQGYNAPNQNSEPISNEPVSQVSTQPELASSDQDYSSAYHTSDDSQFGYESPQYGYSAQAAQLRDYRSAQDEFVAAPPESTGLNATSPSQYGDAPADTYREIPAWQQYQDGPSSDAGYPVSNYQSPIAEETNDNLNSNQFARYHQSDLPAPSSGHEDQFESPNKSSSESQLPSWFTGSGTDSNEKQSSRFEYDSPLRPESIADETNSFNGYSGQAGTVSPELSSEEVDSITDRLQRMLADVNSRKQETEPEAESKPKRWSELYNVSGEPEQDYRESFSGNDAYPSFPQGANATPYDDIRSGNAIDGDLRDEESRLGQSLYPLQSDSVSIPDKNSDDRLDRFTRNVLTPAVAETTPREIEPIPADEEIANELESEAYASALLRAHASSTEDAPSNYQLGRREPISEQFRSPNAPSPSNEYREEISRPSSLSSAAHESESSSSDDEEESIEEYMQRLLKRVRTGSDAEEPAAPAKTNKDRKNTVTEAPVAMATAPGTISRPTQTRPPTASPSTSEFTPRQQAPEQKHDLAALRELANNTARRAIGRSSRRRNSTAVLFKLSVTALAVACATTLLAINGLKLNAPFGGMIASIVVAILWGVDCFKHFVALQSEKAEHVTAETAMETRAAAKQAAAQPNASLQPAAIPAVRGGVASEPKSQSWRPSPMD